MLLTVYDIEANGFLEKNHFPDVYQLGYIRVDTNYNIHGAGSLYFWDDETYEPYREDAAKVHGISEDFLRSQAGNFEKNLATAYALLYKSLVVGKNNILFDNLVIQNFLNKYRNSDVPVFSVGKSIDIQNYMAIHYREWCRNNGIEVSNRKKGTLEEYLKVQGINDNVVRIFAKQNGITLSADRFHDALYDALVTYMSFVWLMRVKGVRIQPV